jgi:hypothetical protein
MQTPVGITVIPTSYPEVVALLKSAPLDAVERAIADRLRAKIIDHASAASISYTQGEISVSGMTVGQIEAYLAANRKPLIDFGVRFLGDQEATSDEQEYPTGEEQDQDQPGVDLGLARGFGIKIAIYHNFLANRAPAELRAFLKNRRIPRHAKFAKELERVFRASQGDRTA